LVYLRSEYAGASSTVTKNITHEHQKRGDEPKGMMEIVVVESENNKNNNGSEYTTATATTTTTTTIGTTAMETTTTVIIENATGKNDIGNDEQPQTLQQQSQMQLQMQMHKKRFSLPLVIGAGQGTTGTHTIFCAVCRLGLPSVHWKRDCDFCDKKKQLPYRPTISDIGVASTNDTNNNTNHYYNHYEDPNRRYIFLPPQKGNNNDDPSVKHPQKLLMKKMALIFTCLRINERNKTEHNRCRNNPILDDMSKWAAIMKDLVDEVITANNVDDDDNDDVKKKKNEGHSTSWRNADSVHDTPYTDMLPYVIESAARNRGLTPLIVTSERDPMDWLQRRSSQHEVLVCRLDILRDHLGGNNNNNESQSVPSPSSATTGSTSSSSNHFDVLSCIDRTIAARKQTMIGNEVEDVVVVVVDLIETFTLMKNLRKGYDRPAVYRWSKSQLLSYMASKFKSHQKFWRPKPPSIGTCLKKM